MTNPDARAVEMAGRLSRPMRLWIMDIDRPQGLGQQRQVRDALIRRGLLLPGFPTIISALGYEVRSILESQ